MHITPHHHQNIICFCVVCAWFCLFFFSLLADIILYQTKETAQYVSMKCRFCSNNTIEFRGSGHINCNIPFLIRILLLVRHTLEMTNSPHSLERFPVSVMCSHMEYAGFVFMFTLTYTLSTTQSYTHTLTHQYTNIAHSKRHLNDTHAQRFCWLLQSFSFSLRRFIVVL